MAIKTCNESGCLKIDEHLTFDRVTVDVYELEI